MLTFPGTGEYVPDAKALRRRSLEHKGHKSISLIARRKIWNFHFFGLTFHGGFSIIYFTVVHYGARCWWRSWLRHFATSWKFGGSNPDCKVKVNL
jgi:hypothetical protein